MIFLINPDYTTTMSTSRKVLINRNTNRRGTDKSGGKLQFRETFDGLIKLSQTPGSIEFYLVYDQLMFYRRFRKGG